MAVAAMVCGIVSLAISVIFGSFGLGWLGSICGIVGIVLGAIARKKTDKKGKATAGLVCGIISLSWGIISTIACVACIGAAASL